MNFIPHYSSSAGNLYSVRSENHTLLIEAGVQIKKARVALQYRLSAVDGCIISHAHADHSKGANDLMKAGIDCYMTIETAEALGWSHVGHRLHIIEALKQFRIADFWTVLPFPTEHDCHGSVGFLVSDGQEKLLFATDTFYVRYRFIGLNLIAVECNYSDETIAPDLDPAIKKRLLTSHFSLKNVLDFFKANDLSAVRELFLLHLSDANSDEAIFKAAIMAATGKPTTVCAK